MKIFKNFSIFAAVILLLCAASRQPASAGMLDVSDRKEIEMGKEAADYLLQQYGEVDDKAERDRAMGVAEPLIKACVRQDLEYHIYVINTDIINAFALPGGYIFITGGLMGFIDDDDELAAVIAHELVHVAHRHGVVMYKKSIKSLLINFLVLAATRDPNAVMANQMFQESRMDIFGRYAEVDADTSSIKYVVDAGYDPHAMIKFLDKMEREQSHYPNLLEDYFEFHPPHDERKQIIMDEYKKLGISTPGGPDRRISERVTVHETCEDNGNCYTALFGGTKELMRLGDKGSMDSVYSRARAVCAGLNDMLDREVKMYETRKELSGDQWTITARKVMIAKVLPGDLVVNEVDSAESLSDKWLVALRQFLWNDFVKEGI